MIGLDALFWMFVILFSIIGALRGWAKEILVTFAAILSLFIISVLESFVPFIRDSLAVNPGAPIFWLRIGLMGALVFFGYQTPNIPKLAGSSKFLRDHFQDTLLGFFLGAINAYLFWGSIWYYLNEIRYSFEIIVPPVEGTAAFEAVEKLLPLLPPNWIGTPVIYFAVAIAFAFLLVVFI
jgi:uncharacterized membrane protein required for colicin V production